jgi:L-iditol 2-dehydrogenase
MLELMRAAVLHRPGDIRVENVPRPEVQANQALLRVVACGVCGSDIPRMLVKGAYKLPLICGHEFSGRVVSLGSGMEGWKEGDLVAVPPLIPCFKCPQCLIGEPSRCEDYDYFGSRRDGAYAEYVIVPATNMLRVPEGIDPTAAALADPAAIALHAVGKTNLSLGQRVAVVGCGPIGLFAIQWARLMGAGDILAIDVSDRKIAMAKEAGATQGSTDSSSASSYGRFDVVIEAAGNAAAFNAALQLVGPGGHAVFIGIPTVDVLVGTKTFEYFLRQEISLHGCWNSFSAPFPGKEWRISLEKLANGQLPWEFMVSHDLDLAELPEMFEKLKTRKEFTSKIIFRA